MSIIVLRRSKQALKPTITQTINSILIQTLCKILHIDSLHRRKNILRLIKVLMTSVRNYILRDQCPKTLCHLGKINNSRWSNLSIITKMSPSHFSRLSNKLSGAPSLWLMKKLRKNRWYWPLHSSTACRIWKVLSTPNCWLQSEPNKMITQINFSKTLTVEISKNSLRRSSLLTAITMTIL